MDGSSMPGAANVGKDAKKLNESIGSTVKFNIDILKYITKNAAVYAASLVTVPQYFRAVSRIYIGYGKFVVKNLLNIIKIQLLKDPLEKATGIIYSNISATNDIISTFLPFKEYISTYLKVGIYFRLLNDIYDGYGNFVIKNLFNIIKIQLSGKILEGSIKIIKNHIETTNDLVNLFPSVIKYILAAIRVKAHFWFLKVLFKSFKKSKITVSFVTKIIKQILMLESVVLAFNILFYTMNKLIGNILKYRGRRIKRAMARIKLLKSLLIHLIDLLNCKALRKYSISKGIATTIKLALIAASLLIIATILSVYGATGPFIFSGMLVLFALTLMIVGLFKIIQKARVYDFDTTLLMFTISSFITAWASAKLAETIAPLASVAGQILLGSFVICTITLMFIGVFELIARRSSNIRAIIGLTIAISIFLSAWVAAKVAQTIAPLARIAKQVLLGAAVVSGVILILCFAFWIVQKLIKPAKVVFIAIALVLLSFAIMITFMNLSFAMMFAPFALLTIGAVLVIAGVVALIGLIWKPILKGALVLLVMAIAMSILAEPILIFGITGALLALTCGSPAMVFSVVGAMLGILIGIALTAALLGALASTGVLWVGIAALKALGIAMVALAMPLIIIAVAMAILSKVKVKEDSLAKVMRCIVNGFKVFFEGDNWKYLNPISLGYIMMCMAPLTLIVAAVGRIADVLQHIASLNIPIEWDNRGRPTKYRQMNAEDFANAAQNAGDILVFWAKLFTDDTIIFQGQNIKNPVAKFIRALNSSGGMSLGVKIAFRRLSKIVGYVGDMADTLQHIASLNIPIEWDENGKPKKFKAMAKKDFELACDNAGMIITFWANLFSSPTLNGPDGQTVQNSVFKVVQAIKQGGIFGSGGLTLGVKVAFRRLSKIVGYVGNMADVLQKIASMNMPVEWDKDGKPIKFQKMDRSDFKKYADTVADIIETLCTAATSDKVKTLIQYSLLDMDDAFENLGLLTKPISDMTNIITNLASFQIPITDATGQILKDKDGNIQTRLFDFNKDIARVRPTIAAIVGGMVDIANYTALCLVDAVSTWDAEDAFNNLAILVQPIAAMTDMIIKLSTFRVPVGYDSKGNPTGYTIISSDDITRATALVQQIADATLGLLFKVNHKTQQVDNTWLFLQLRSIKNNKDVIEEGSATLSNFVSSLGTISSTILENDKLTKADIFANLGPNIDTFIASIGKFKTTDPQALIKFGNISTVIERIGKVGAENIKETTESLSNFLQKINDTNLDKLKTAADMMKSIAEVTQEIHGDFNKLADTINEKLITVLEDLKEVLDDTSEKLTDIKDKANNISSTATNAISSPSSKESPVATAPAKVDEDKNKKVDLTQTNTKIDRVVSEIGALTAELAKWRSSM